MPESQLAQLQRRFWRLISAPSGVGPALEAGVDDTPPEDWIVAHSRQEAIDRLDIYANMYFFRLLEILGQDFAAVARALGDERFHNLITDYLVAHPPDTPSVRDVGRHLPAFLEGHALPWLAELARLEWLRLEVFDREEVPLLRPEHLAALPAEGWPALILTLAPAVRLLETTHPVDEIWQALRDRGSPPREVEPGPRALLIWRRGFSVFHRPLEPDEHLALQLVQLGTPFAAICEALAGEDEDPAARLAGLLRGWIAAGLLTRPDETPDVANDVEHHNRQAGAPAVQQTA